MKAELLSPMDFDQLSMVEIPVTVKGKKYTLREATENATIKFRTFQFQNSKMVDGKLNADADKLIESLMVSLCLYEGDNLVPLDVVRSWPAKVVKQLFDRVIAISALDEADSEEALEKQKAETEKKLQALRNGQDRGKNLPSATTATSA